MFGESKPPYRLNMGTSPKLEQATDHSHMLTMENVVGLLPLLILVAAVVFVVFRGLGGSKHDVKGDGDHASGGD